VSRRWFFGAADAATRDGRDAALRDIAHRYERPS
jgi:hypothetical protein